MKFKAWWNESGKNLLSKVANLWFVPRKIKGALIIVITIIDQWLAMEADEGVTTFAANRGTTTLSQLNVDDIA